MSNAQTRRQRRYTLVNPELVQAEILFAESGSAEGVTAELREISQSDVKLLVMGPPELQLECRIVLKSHRFKSPLVLPAEVHWARPNPAGDWLLGCHLATPLADEKIQELIDSGVLNRRSSVRQRSRIPVQAQLQAGMPRLSAIVSDFSEGGICLTIAEAAQGTRHVCVFGSVLGQEARIPLKIRWTLPVGPNRLIGCEFMRPADYQILRKMHVATQKQHLAEHLHLGSRANRSLAACGDGALEVVNAQSADPR
jgi:hypothetical protein